MSTSDNNTVVEIKQKQGCFFCKNSSYISDDEVTEKQDKKHDEKCKNKSSKIKTKIVNKIYTKKILKNYIKEKKTIINYLKEKLEKEYKKLQVLECDLEEFELSNINEE